MKIVAEYIWLGGKEQLRSKSRTITINIPENKEISINLLENKLLNISLYESWTYDGSSTWESKGEDSEIILQPVYVCIDPFRSSPNVFVLCDTYYPDGSPTKCNHRNNAKKIFDNNLELKPWFGIEQEFFLMENNKDTPSKSSYIPLGYSHADTVPQGQYYCSAGSNNAFGRKIAETAYHLCLKAGINASGMNAEVAPGQWEIQVGPCEGINAGDLLLITRYILHRVGEMHNVQINIHPKPILGNWNGSGCHTNYSTKKMRDGDENKTGLEYIEEAIEKLSKKHKEHMEVYGSGNDLRMTGKCETSSYDKFSYGVADRGASVRIPRSTEKNKKGYFEDRRPSSNMDPYLVTSKIFETTCLYSCMISFNSVSLRISTFAPLALPLVASKSN